MESEENPRNGKMEEEPAETKILDGTSITETVEIIHLDIQGDVKPEDKGEKPKTAKDFLADFKVESGSEYEQDNEKCRETDTDSDNEPLLKRVKKENVNGKKEKTNNEVNLRKKYKKEWEEIPSVRPWISESVHGQCYFFCKFCKKDYKCGKSEVFKHMSSMKHKKHTTQPPQKKNTQQMFKFRGLLCPVVTPFMKTRNKDVNYDMLRPYAKFLKACGVKGVLVNDILGEGMSLTIEERKKLVELWSELCQEKGMFLMVQVGGAPLKSVIQMAMHAEKTKVGAIVLLPDLYNRPKNHLDLVRYVKSVSNHINSIPILYHHHPKHTNLDIDMKAFLLDITGEVDNFLGIIYSTSDLEEGISTMELNPDRFVVFMGTDEGMLGAVASGFTCIMANSINLLPKLTESVCQCMKNGEIKSAQVSQNLLRKTLFTIYSFGETVPTLKAAMSIVIKLPMEPVREPLQTVWEGTLIKMKEKLHAIGII